MNKLVVATRAYIDQREGLRMALLSAISFALGVTFLALLVADQAHASTF